jgi:hypothetical protein
VTHGIILISGVNGTPLALDSHPEPEHITRPPESRRLPDRFASDEPVSAA